MIIFNRRLSSIEQPSNIAFMSVARLYGRLQRYSYRYEDTALDRRSCNVNGQVTVARGVALSLNGVVCASAAIHDGASSAGNIRATEMNIISPNHGRNIYACGGSVTYQYDEVPGDTPVTPTI